MYSTSFSFFKICFSLADVLETCVACLLNLHYSYTTLQENMLKIMFVASAVLVTGNTTFFTRKHFTLHYTVMQCAAQAFTIVLKICFVIVGKVPNDMRYLI